MAQTSNNFSEAMNKVYSLLFKDYGSDHPVIDTLYDWFYDRENSNLTGDETVFEFDKEGMFHLLRDMMNYDIFWVTGQGKVDVKNANHPVIAKLVSPFVTKDMCKRVLATF